MILTIRAHRRYAIRQTVALSRMTDGSCFRGLMIELSSEGCRISGLVGSTLAPGDPVTVEHRDMRLRGNVCWFHSGIAGIRLDTPLTVSELNARLIDLRDDGSSRGTTAQDGRAMRRQA